MRIDEKHVIVEGVVVWDGVTQPKNNDQGKMVHSLKVAIRPNAPELAEIEQLATAALQADSTMKGQLPTGGSWPIKLGTAGEIDPALVGYTPCNTKTYAGAPQVFDINGRQLTAMEYGPLLYAGAIVKVITHAYSFTNIQKGVAFGLDGIQIIDATTPKLSVAAGYDATGVFGAAATPGAAPAPGAPLAPPPALGVTPPPPAPPAGVQPHPGFLAGPSATPPPPAPGLTRTATSPGSYEELQAAGWSDQQMIDAGHMVRG